LDPLSNQPDLDFSQQEGLDRMANKHKKIAFCETQAHYKVLLTEFPCTSNVLLPKTATSLVIFLNCGYRGCIRPLIQLILMTNGLNAKQ
jgi:hypothetical protein